MSMRTVLIVDDEPDVCWAVASLLKSRGYSVLTVSSGSEALALLRQRCYYRLFVDAKLQDMDGLEVARRAQALCPGIHVALISAYYYRDDPAIMSAQRAGTICCFIPKPFSHQEVLKVVADPPITSNG
jgi:CheY-like chemotaxis protein